MSGARLVFASLVYHRRTNLAVALAVAAAVAVLTGALMVGDSTRGSLRGLALARLGRIDEVLLVDRFFRAALADELAGQPGFDRDFTEAVPAIFLRATLSHTGADGSRRRVGRVSVIGCDERFGRLGAGGPEAMPAGRQIVLVRPLAEQLGVGPGDWVVLYVASPEGIPADTPLGRKDATPRSARLRVAAVIPPEGLGRFSLANAQESPRNAFVPLATLAELLEQPGRANAILVAGRDAQTPPSEDAHRRLDGLLHPRLEDYGLQVERTESGYVNITSDRLLLGPETEAALDRALRRGGRSGEASAGGTPRIQPALVYLANTIACGPREIPYSTIAAIDFQKEPPLGPLEIEKEPPLPSPIGRGAGGEGRAGESHRVRARTHQADETTDVDEVDENGTADENTDRKGTVPFSLRENRDSPQGAHENRDSPQDEIILNAWAAERLGAAVGDVVQVSYFEPESAHGAVVERSATFRLAGVTPLSGAAADAALVPRVPGVTDELTMADWDPPFPFDARRIGPEDEEYWERHRATPKAFVSLATGRRLWASRFGQTTSLRVAPRDAADTEAILSLELPPGELGFVFQPVKRQALAAASGATPFGVLFLAFSFFLIASAVMLVAILFRLGVETRAGQIGLLAALGLTRRRIARLLLAEGLLVATAGSLAGALLGIGYAAGMLLGLRTWWLPAVGTPFLRLHVDPVSLTVGPIAGVVAAGVVIAWTLWRLAPASPRRLLAGQLSDGLAGALSGGARRSRAGRLISAMVIGVLVVAGVATLWIANRSDQYAQGAFFAAGAMALGALLVGVRQWLVRRASGRMVAAGRGNLLRLALGNAARHPGRSSLSVGLVATACFLITATSAFYVDPAGRQPRRESGDGGFALVAESDQPIYQSLDSPEGRRALGFSDEDEALLASCRVYALRVRSGDDASCLNLYQARRPRVLGVPEGLVARGGFAWAAAAEPAEPWKALDQGGADGAVPVVLDKNTANYALHLWGGLGESYTLPNAPDRDVPMTVVGLLDGFLLQGDLLISEKEFLAHFPDTSGYRLFLIEAPPAKTRAVAAALGRTLGDFGLAVETSGGRLAAFLAVQNTYLGTFRSLGGLGLLLGTFGLAAVQMRNVLERRRELALLGAVGLRARWIGGLVLAENAFLLVAGLGCGAAAALVALVPHLARGAASLPWVSLAATLGAVLLVGLAASLAAVRTAVGALPASALREE